MIWRQLSQRSRDRGGLRRAMAGLQSHCLWMWDILNKFRTGCNFRVCWVGRDLREAVVTKRWRQRWNWVRGRYCSIGLGGQTEGRARFGRGIQGELPEVTKVFKKAKHGWNSDYHISWQNQGRWWFVEKPEVQPHFGLPTETRDQRIAAYLVSTASVPVYKLVTDFLNFLSKKDKTTLRTLVPGGRRGRF